MPTWTPPVTLVPNTPENVNDVNAIFTSLQATINGGLDEVNVPNLAAAFTHWKTIAWGGGQVPGGTTAATYLAFGGGNVAGGNSVLALGAGSSGGLAFPFDPSDYTANTRATRVRIRAMVLTNAVAPAVTFTPGLALVASTGGASGSNPTIATIGAVAASATIASPTAPGFTHAAGTEAAAPALGAYVFTVQVSGTTAVGSVAYVIIELQMRQV